MKSENKYIGDDKFKKLLEHYHCELPLEVIKLRFAGAICSPNLSLRPADVINSFWEKNKQPRIETKNEADLFFKFFMGLWDEIFEDVKNNQIKLSELKLNTQQDVENYCLLRYNEIENGFSEGFWGGKDNLQVPAFLAQLMDSMTEMSEIYANMPKKSEKTSDFKTIFDALKSTDKMVEKTINFIVENFVLPRIDSLQKNVN